MRTDFFLFGGILVFFFILWVYSGGPNHPISFAGPYLTPVTEVEHTLTNSSISSGLPGAGGTYSSSDTNEVPSSRRSPVFGIVRISNGNFGTGSATTETINLHSQANYSIDITGWQLASVKTGVRFTLPRGTTLPHRNGSGVLNDILLTPNGTAIVATSYPPVNQSYLENTCTDQLVTSDYEHCVFLHKDDSGFTRNQWRVFLFQSRPVWKQSGDTIQLIDRSGKIVDQYTY